MPPELPSVGARRANKAWILGALLAFTTTCVVILITVGVTVFMPKVYQAGARMTLAVDRQNHVWSPQGDDRSLQLPIIHRLESAQTLDKVISELDLKTKWGNRFNEGNALPLELVRKYLKASCDVVFEKNSDVFVVRAFSESRNEAAALANALAENLGVPTTAGTVTIFEPAEVPLKPSRPNFPLNMTLGLFVGAILGGLLGGAVVVISKWPNARQKVSRAY